MRRTSPGHDVRVIENMCEIFGRNCWSIIDERTHGGDNPPAAQSVLNEIAKDTRREGSYETRMNSVGRVYRDIRVLGRRSVETRARDGWIMRERATK